MKCLRGVFAAGVLGLVLHAASARNVASYEYWLDEDFQGRTSVAPANDDFTAGVDVSDLDPGIHFLNFRAKDDEGGISAPYRFLFNIPEERDLKAGLAYCEHWLDGDFAGRSVKKAAEENLFAIDVSHLSPGLHFWNYRVSNEEGDWSVPFTYLLYLAEPQEKRSGLAGFEYWLDNEHSKAKRVATTQEEHVIAVETAGLESGLHFLNYRAFTENGTWGLPERYLFYLAENDVKDGELLCGYEYGFNGQRTEVEFPPCKDYELSEITFPLPDPKEVGCIAEDDGFIFHDHRAELSKVMDIGFTLMFRNVAGEWSHPMVTEYEDSYKLEHACIELPIQKEITIGKTSAGDFIALEFDIETTGTYYLRATQPCSMMLFNYSGQRLGTIGSKGMLETQSVELAAGHYYGVVFDTLKDSEWTEDELKLRLMTSLNAIMTPDISFADGMVSISCSQEDVEIRYTLDGNTPDGNSTLYTEPFPLARNATVKAVARAADYGDSFVATLTVDCYKVEQPEIRYANLQVHISCPTAEATLLYTLDGTDPKTDGTLYITPVSVRQNCTVRAIGRRDGWHDSEEAEFALDVSNVKCVAPELTVGGNLLTMTTLTQGATIHYTDDGSEPTASSRVYTMPILLERNAIYRAIAVKAGEIDSEESWLAVDWFEAGMPEFSLDGEMLAITSATAGATIRYSFEPEWPDATAAVYSQPIRLTDNRKVRAYAQAEGFNDSPPAEFAPDFFACEQPGITYDGRSFTLSTSTEGAEIRYTLDGTTPTANSGETYVGMVSPGNLCTVKALALKENMNPSAVTSYILPCHYDNGLAQLNEAGTLSRAFEWCGGNPNVDELTITGPMDDMDFAVVKSLGELRHLDLEGVRTARIPDSAFAGMDLRSLSTPTAGFEAGSGLLAGCRELTSIDWNSQTPVPDDLLGGAEMPNLLLFVRYAYVAGPVWRNVVVNGTAQEITLEESTTSNFHNPRPFTARRITYRRTFAQESGYGRSGGWEALSLPFAPTTIKHATQGRIAPFAAGEAGAKPFWLCELGGGGFANCASIEANAPYIISMPNNANYSDDYILAGEVEFEGKDVTVEPSDALQTGIYGRHVLTPTFRNLAKEAGMELNVGETYAGRQPGSLFVQSLRPVSPFECYVASAGAAFRPGDTLDIGFDGSGTDDALLTAPIAVGRHGLELWINGLQEGDRVEVSGSDGMKLHASRADGPQMRIELKERDVVVLSIERRGRLVKREKIIF